MIHEDFPIDSFVSFLMGNVCGSGRVAGIASDHIFRTYILILDKPLDVPGYKDWSAVACPGQCMTLLTNEEHKDIKYGPLRPCKDCGVPERLDTMMFDRTRCGECFNKRGR